MVISKQYDNNKKITIAVSLHQTIPPLWEKTVVIHPLQNLD